MSVESESVSSNAPSSTNRKADNSRESGARQTYKTIDQNSSTSLVNNSLSAPQPNISDSSHHINNNRLGVTITEKDSSTNTQTSKSIPTLDPIAASSKNGNTAAAIQPTPSTISATSSDEDIVIRVAYKKTNDFAVGFRVKPFQPLNKIFDVYCQRRGKPRSFFQFFFNDVVVRDDQTPLSIGIEDKNTIFALPKYE